VSSIFSFSFISQPSSPVECVSPTTQFDVPKTNVQARYDTKVVGSYFPELVKIARQRGIRGLYAGLGPTLVRAFPANAALFLGVETGKKAFDNFVWKE
jgi:solute carrier family 25 (mitochondrial carnitine/acylcarnitine transporter), member 20/29